MALQKLDKKIEEWLKEGFFIYKNNFLLLLISVLLAWTLSVFVAALFVGPMLTGVTLFTDNAAIRLLIAFVAFATSQVSFGIMGGPLFAGLTLITLGLAKGNAPKPGVGDLFKGFKYFLNAFLFMAVWSVLYLILQIIAPFIFSPVLLPVVPVLSSIATGTFSMFGLFLVVDRKRTFLQAFMESFRMAWKHRWLYAAVVLAAGVISLSGLLLCGVGVIITAPFYYCVMAVIYRDVEKV